MKTTTLTIADKCTKCGTLTLEIDPEGDVHCWACGTTFGKPEKVDYLLERHQFYEKNKAAILADVKSIGRKATAKKWKLNGVSLYHVLQRWESESKASKGETKEVVEETKSAVEETNEAKGEKKNAAGRKKQTDYSRLPMVIKGRYFRDNKDAIIADLINLGRVKTRVKWNISRSALYKLEGKWLTKSQRKQLTSMSCSIAAQVPPKDTSGPNGRVTAFPKFSNTWDPTVQLKWLEIYEKLIGKEG